MDHTEQLIQTAIKDVKRAKPQAMLMQLQLPITPWDLYMAAALSRPTIDAKRAAEEADRAIKEREERHGQTAPEG